jgi:hypothetical protein
MALAVVAAFAAVHYQHRAVTPTEFATFAQKLDTLSAPAGSFTPYDPIVDGTYGSTPQENWTLIGTRTWSSTSDPTGWVAVRGWQATVTPAQEAATCRSVLSWFATAGSQLGLSTPNPNETESTCHMVLATVRSSSGSDAWSDRGTQTADGQPRYRTGAETFSGPVPGQVTIRVEADATIAAP